jgi:hypothetical protein
MAAHLFFWGSALYDAIRVVAAESGISGRTRLRAIRAGKTALAGSIQRSGGFSISEASLVRWR